MLKLMEPVLLLFLASAVMFVFLALVVPMMQLGTQLGRSQMGNFASISGSASIWGNLGLGYR